MATITITPGWAGPASAVGTNPIVVQVAGVGPTGPAGTSGVAPSGTGIVTVTSGSLNTPAALTGDVTTTAGGLATTLATVNSNVGAFTNASITVNAKGLVTAASSGAAGGITIGDTVTSGTSGRVLYVGAGPVLAQNAGFTFNSSPSSTDGLALSRDGNLSLSGVRVGLGGFATTLAFEVRHDYFSIARIQVGTSSNAHYCLGSSGSVRFWGHTDLASSSDWDAELKRAASKVIGLTDGSTGGGTLSSVPLTPAQITSNQNNYAPGVARFYRLSTDASRDITGLSCSQVSGQECEVWNVGSFAIVLKHQDVNSTAANRFLIDTGADLTIQPNSRVELRYDSTQSRWVVASPAGLAIGDTVTSGTAGRVLYVGSGSVLAQDAGLTYDPATDTLTAGTVISTASVFKTAAGTGYFAITGDGTGVYLAAANTANVLKVGGDGLVALSGYSFGWVASGGTYGASADTASARAAAKVIGLTDGSTGGGTLSSVPLTPAQITSNQNNYAPGVARYYRLSTDASRDITGLSCSQVSGQECEVWNVGSFAIVLKHQDVNSTAANRFICTGAADITLAADEVALLRYDSVTSRWRVRKV